jgi:hypothetical protein
MKRAIEVLMDDIEAAHAVAEQGLKTYPHDSVFQHSSAQLAMLKSFLLKDNDVEAAILEDFDLGLMAARELGPDERDFADLLHRIQRQVEALR